MTHVRFCASVLLVVLGLCTTNLSGQSFEWDEKTSMPMGRWGASTFVIDNLAYVVGGRSGSEDRVEMWAYDADLNSWTAKAPIPIGRRLAAAFSINGKGYVACGLTGTSTKLNDLWEYDPVTNTWTAKATFPGEARYGTFHFAVNGKGYVGAGNIGSSSGPFLSNAWSYDPTVNAWSSMNSIPDLARHGTSSFTMNGKAYVFGGKESDQNFTTDLWEFDPSSSTWQALAPFPGSPRSSPMAFVFGNIAVIGCGRNETDNFFDVWMYNRITDQWSITLQYPGESSLAGTSFRIGDRAFGGLGWLLSDNSSRADLWELIKPDDVGISDRDGNQEITVFPNPVNGDEDITLIHPSLIPVIVEIVSSDGALLGSWRLSSGSIVPWTNRKPGTYFVRVVDAVRVVTTPIVVSATSLD